MVTRGVTNPLELSTRVAASIPEGETRSLSKGVIVLSAADRPEIKILEGKVRKQKNQWFWSLPDLPEVECEEELSERIGVPDGDSCVTPRETVPNWLEASDAEVEELAMTNEMVLVS
jgi:hypothetical protein